MLDTLLTGDVARFWMQYYFTIPATALALVLGLVVLDKSGKTTIGLVLKGISITSVIATLPLTFEQVGLNIAISDMYAVSYASIIGTGVSLMAGFPFLFVKKNNHKEIKAGFMAQQEVRLNKGLVDQADAALNIESDTEDLFLNEPNNINANVSEQSKGVNKNPVKNLDEELEGTNNTPAVITIGRASDNDLVIENDPKVSRYHGRLINIADEYLIEDMDSTNGIRVNGSKVPSSKIDETSVVRFGDTELDLSTLIDPEVKSNKDDLVQEVIDKPVNKSSVDRNKEVEVGLTLDPINKAETSNAWITIKNGTQKSTTHSIVDRYTTIGRSSENNLQLFDAKASRKHAIIKKVNKKYVIFDAGSTRGTSINNELILGVRLEVGSGTLKIGGTELNVVGHDSVEQEIEFGTSDGTDGSEIETSGAIAIVKKGPDSGKTFSIEEGVNYIGRGLGNGISLTDQMVSRQHCVIVKKDESYHVFELGSKSGSYVGDQIVKGRFLQSGDLLTIGKTQMIFTKVDVD